MRIYRSPHFGWLIQLRDARSVIVRSLRNRGAQRILRNLAGV